ncbi:alpha/beta fold hydrolase BchO [Roseovarius salis]|uniref:alpha/beta fold hydrolase BchO n=1 Tax=Roseovarius salis TaxID=3376063 RepID=UPI0037C9B3FB
MDWTRDLPGWPLQDLSRRVRCRPHEWHVQEAGTGQTILLLHGAGGATHSWRDLLPALAEGYHAVAIDLPGQGFTRAGTRRRLGLSQMSSDIASLCAAQGWHPRAIIGHSAGAAIALDLAGRLAGPGGDPPGVVGINAALDRFDGIAGWLFPALAKLLALNPLTASAFTLGRNHAARAQRLIESTGSHINATGLTCYARLFSDRPHVDATLQMMAQWNVDALVARLPEATGRCLLLTGSRDSAVSPEVSRRAAARMPRCETGDLGPLGHLAHEEAPAETLRHITGWLARG